MQKRLAAAAVHRDRLLHRLWYYTGKKHYVSTAYIEKEVWRGARACGASDLAAATVMGKEEGAAATPKPEVLRETSGFERRSNEAIRSFRGSYSNRGNGASAVCPDVVGLRSPCTDPNPQPNRSPTKWVRFGKGGRSLRIWSFRGAYANRGNGMEQASSDVVEAGGVEPPSESVSAGTSPCAGGYCGPKALSPPGGQAVTPCRSGSFMMHGARKA